MMAWPIHKLECKMGGGVFKKLLLKGLAQELPVAIRRDHSEKSLLYLRDKFPNARELQSSGLREVLSDLKAQHDPQKCKTPGCWLCPSVESVVNEILAFAADGVHSRTMTKLRGIIAQGQGNVCYYPGAMLDLSQPLAAIGASENITRLVCVSSFEVDTIERMFRAPRGDTAAFCSQIQQELQGSSLVLKSTLISDSRLDADSEALGPIRIEYEVLLRGERVKKAHATKGGEPGKNLHQRSIRVVYYVNEDFCSFWPPEVDLDGSIAVLYAAKTCLPLWELKDGGWVQELKRRSNPSTVFISDSTTVCEPPLLFFFLAAAEGGRGTRPLPQEVIEEHLSEAFVMPLMTSLPLLSVTEDLIAHSKKSGQSSGYQTQEESFNVRVLCAWRLDQVLILASKAVQAVLDESARRSKKKQGDSDQIILEETRKMFAEFLTQEFATVVRVDGFKRLPASSSMAAMLRHHLTHSSVQSIKDSLPEWKAQEIRQLRISVGLEG